MDNLINQKFGRYTVEAYSHSKDPHHYWICVCECGNRKTVQGAHLKSGHTKSCGCLNLDKIISRNISRGSGKTPFYRKWHAMIRRCYNPEDDSYKDYGGRGIKVCSEWYSNRESFYKWCSTSAYKKGLSLDRNDNDGDYCPENCRWATTKQQNRNTRANKLDSNKVYVIRDLHTAGAFTGTELANIYNVSISTISMVVNKRSWV